ncbi:rCG37432 [Rattus norvegicus]|uniref:RCG37432 n=1 Tax=Rattus norvegicus TaxID=10116 RepID=A6KHL9_RAT|nr:rCG37432 [Rattus norvegicus]
MKEPRLREVLRLTQGDPADQTAWLQNLHYKSPEPLSKRPNMPALGEWVDSCKECPSPSHVCCVHHIPINLLLGKRQKLSNQSNEKLRCRDHAPLLTFGQSQVEL